jgi:hypothetical protein
VKGHLVAAEHDERVERRAMGLAAGQAMAEADPKRRASDGEAHAATGATAVALLVGQGHVGDNAPTRIPLLRKSAPRLATPT